jgi:hypothetical protein
MLEQAAPSGAVALACAELAADFLADLRRLDAQLRGARKKLAAAVLSVAALSSHPCGNAGPK